MVANDARLVAIIGGAAERVRWVVVIGALAMFVGVESMAIIGSPSLETLRSMSIGILTRQNAR